jgi:hypothetical protein
MRIAFSGGIAGVRPAPAQRRLAALEPAAAAWLASVPVAVLTLAAIVLLGPPLGSTLLPAPSARFFAGTAAGVNPEPTEQARFLIALTAPLLLAAGTLALVRRPPQRLAAEAAAALAQRIELVAVALLVACFVAQRVLPPQGRPGAPPIVYFSIPSVVVAAAVAAALALAARSARVRRSWARWSAETRWRGVAAALVALVALAITLLPSLYTDGSLGHAYEAVIYHLQFTYDESVAVLDGRSPLGDFATQYSALWPYVAAGAMSLLSPSVGTFTGMMATLIGLTLLAMYDILRRAARSSLAALALFLPLLATCAFQLHGPTVSRFSLMTYFGVLPLRYAGPFFLAWLLARHLDGARPRRIWPLFLTAGLVVLNNTDFGLAALGATVAALVWTQPRRPDARTARRLALEALGGLAAAFALVSALLLSRTGELPHLGLLVRYAHIFVVDGFAMLPIRPVVGFSTIIFLTHVAAIGVATVRALRRDPDRLMTGMLVWTAVFGLGAGSYYVGHSLSEVLEYTFPPWGLSVALLTLLALRGAARQVRWPSPAQLACLFAFGLLVSSISQTAPPWRQVKRIARSGPEVFAHPIGERFVAEHAQRGESVLVMSGLGHRIAFNLGLDDVERFTGARSMLTAEQLDESLAALRRAGGTKVFVLLVESFPGMTETLNRDYELRGTGEEGMALWVAR